MGKKLKTYYQVSIFKNGNRVFTGKIQSFLKPNNSTDYEWYDSREEAINRNKF